MLSPHWLNKYCPIALLATLGFVSLGSTAASAATVTFQNSDGSSQTLLDFACDLKTTSTCSQSFNNYDDPTKWLTILGPGGDLQKWGVKGTLTLANASLGTSTTGQQLGGKVFTFTAATLGYMQGTAATSSFTGLKFLSGNMDFTTTAFGKTTLLSNPYLMHQTSGLFLANANSSVNSSDRLDSSLDLTVSGKDGTGATVTNQQLNNILQNTSAKSGTPSGTSFSFVDSGTKSNIIAQLSSATIANNLLNLTLGQGDSMHLPASECLIVGQMDSHGTRIYDDGEDDGQDKSKGNNGVGNGEDSQPPGNPPINDGPGTGPGNPGNKQGGGAAGDSHGKFDHTGNSGDSHESSEDSQSNNGGLMTSSQAEQLCHQVALSVQPASVPEPTSEIPVLGSLLLAGLGWSARKFFA